MKTSTVLMLPGQQVRSISSRPRLCTFKQCMWPALWKTDGSHGSSSGLSHVRQQPRPQQCPSEPAGEHQLPFSLYAQDHLFRGCEATKVSLFVNCLQAHLNLPVATGDYFLSTYYLSMYIVSVKLKAKYVYTVTQASISPHLKAAST